MPNSVPSRWRSRNVGSAVTTPRTRSIAGRIVVSFRTVSNSFVSPGARFSSAIGIECVASNHDPIW